MQNPHKCHLHPCLGLCALSWVRVGREPHTAIERAVKDCREDLGEKQSDKFDGKG
jgi:hypothetical protein